MSNSFYERFDSEIFVDRQRRKVLQINILFFQLYRSVQVHQKNVNIHTLVVRNNLFGNFSIDDQITTVSQLVTR